MIKLVAFDWNGTILADTVPCWEGANNELKAAGAKEISLKKFRQTFAIPYIDILVENGADRRYCLKNSKKISDAFHNYYEPRVAKCRTRAGAREILSWLGKNKIRSVIFSNHLIVSIQSQLKRLKIVHHMDVVLANDDIKNWKRISKGEKLNEYAEKRGFAPKEVLTVGDTPEEIEIGKKYGYHTAAISGGYSTIARLKKRHPDFLIHNLAELIGIIKRLNKNIK